MEGRSSLPPAPPFPVSLLPAPPPFLPHTPQPLLLPPAIAPPSLIWQTPHHLRRHFAELLDNVSLLKAVADELDAIIAVKSAEKRPRTQGWEHHDSSLEKDCSDNSDGFSKPTGSLSSSEAMLLQAVEARADDLHNLESMAVEAATGLQEAIENQLAPLIAILNGTASWEEAAAVAKLADRQRKKKRNRRWRQRRRQRAAEASRKERERYEQADQEADEWRANEIAKGIARRKMEKMKEVAKRQAKEDQKKLEEELELILIVEKLQELRSLRIRKLKRQGRFFPEEDNKFMERVQAAVEEEERQAAAAADTNATVVAIANAQEAVKNVGLSHPRAEVQKKAPIDKSETGANQPLSIEKKERELNVVPVDKEGTRTKGGDFSSAGQEGYRGLPPEFYYYYYGSSADMGTLIEVRRMWDTFIMPGGSRIPGHWIEPPPPADPVWASYLIN